VTVPLLPELQAAIASMSANDALTLLTTQCGRPFNSPSAFGVRRKVVRVSRLPPVTRDDDEVFDAFGYHIQMEALDETIMAFDYGGIFGVISGVKLHPPFVC
jgi:hypothetical protein